ncbi:MAG: T9SS type A sorting domain-containing protein [Saprospiraceae bacterium]|nr:T9SS type A sorting domain-containing protein [Saprospiraceae bacterium]MDW8484901.1 T9SS type A sorting domain-containing protein [Saprospiraceae bacterium]
MRQIFFLFAFGWIVGAVAYAQPGSLDMTFNAADVGFDAGKGFSPAKIRTMLRLPDGKILVGGEFTHFDGELRSVLLRLHADGTVDKTFTHGGVLSGEVRALARQSDGKILLGGNFLVNNGAKGRHITRLNPDGSLDESFVPTWPDGPVDAVTLMPNGRIVIAGDFLRVANMKAHRIARLNPNGSLDMAFDSGSGVSGRIYAMRPLADGRLIIAGFISSYNGVNVDQIGRVLPNGAWDPTFHVSKVLSGVVYSIDLQPDGKIIVGGRIYADLAQSIGRLNPDGTIDKTFKAGTGFNRDVLGVALQPDGKILVCGDFDLYDGQVATGRIARLNADGSLDSGFDFNAEFNGPVQAMALQEDGKIVVAGDFSYYGGVYYRRTLARLNPNGTLDESYQHRPIGFDSDVFRMAIQPDGKIVVVGSFGHFYDKRRSRIARLNPDGTLDETFGSNVVGSGFDLSPRSIAIQPDGKILLAGPFFSYGPQLAMHTVRLNADGTRDSTFDVGFKWENFVHTISLQPDGKIIAGGEFLAFGNVPRRGIARLNSNGTLDLTFNPGSGFDGGWGVYLTELQSDGKILAVGSFTSFDGKPANYIARLNQNGTLDETFSPPAGGPNDLVYALALQPDGKILISGDFTQYGNLSQPRLARLNADGTLDNTFQVGSGLNMGATSIVVEPDGKIIIAGNFTSYNGTPVRRIARLNPNGTLDPTFNTGQGFNDIVYHLLRQPHDGKILAGGRFTGYNGTGRNRIARLFSGQGVSVSESDFGMALKCYPNPTFGEVFVDLGQMFPDIQVIVRNAVGRTVSTHRFGAAQVLRWHLDGASGLYFAEVRSGDGKATVVKIVKR